MMRTVPLSIFAVSALAASSASSQQPAEVAIRAAVQAYVAAFNSADAEAAAATYAPDGSHTYAAGFTHHGRVEIARGLRELLAGPMKGARISIASLVDATDCFRGHTLKQLMVDLERLARSIHQIVFEDHVGHKPGYKNIMVSGVYARLAWNVDAEARLCVDLGSVFSIYAHSRNTLLGHRARWLRDSLEEGFKLLGATVGETDVA